MMASGSFRLQTGATHAMLNITSEIEKILVQVGANSGFLHLFNPHTTSGLTINEGADPDVQKDLLAGLQQLVPSLAYRHREGNSPAHLMTLLTGSELTLQINDGRLLLGTWQQIFLCEYDGPRTRTIHWKIFLENNNE